MIFHSKFSQFKNLKIANCKVRGSLILILPFLLSCSLELYKSSGRKKFEDTYGNFYVATTALKMMNCPQPEPDQKKISALVYPINNQIEVYIQKDQYECRTRFASMKEWEDFCQEAEAISFK